MSLKKKLFSLFLFILLVFLIEWLGHALTMSSVQTWYSTLVKPTWNPPAYVFGPIWTILYLMMAIAGWLIYVKCPSSITKKYAFLYYTLQLTFNLSWSFFFFFLQSPLLGLIDISFLLICIFLNMRSFYRIDKLSGVLLMPYLIWVFFAAILNLTIWNLNR
jgi:benzodiazapine receptor